MQIKELLKFKSYGLVHLQGDLEAIIEQVSSPEKSNETSLIFVSKQEFVDLALSKRGRYFVKTDSLQFQFPENCTVFSAPSLSLAMALILPFFDNKRSRFENSQQNFVHPTARVGENVVIAPFAVIGARSIIGSNCMIGSGVVIENDCVIGANTCLHPQVFIGAQTEIGTRCEIHPHTTIGADGFGYVTDPQTKKHHKVPQIGKVIIEDDVEIGANCAIDRATLTATIIRKGSKLDNFIHIAHNCDIGDNAMITASFTIAGSSKIGKQFKCGGQTGVTDHVSIADDVTLAGRTGVLQSITEPGVYGGFPAMKIQKYLKTNVALDSLSDMWKDWRRSKPKA